MGCRGRVVLLVGTTILKGLGVLRIVGVRVLWFLKVWSGWMPQQCRSSARNHHPERAEGLKGYEVLRVWGLKLRPERMPRRFCSSGPNHHHPARVERLRGYIGLEGFGFLPDS